MSTRAQVMGAQGVCSPLASCVKPLAIAAVVGGLLGGLAMILINILYMGASGMGYATPLNVGMAAFTYTITPPMSMVPMLMDAMKGHATPGMMASMQALQSGHATNSTVASLMSSMPASLRDTVMVNMPVHTDHVVVGSILHFAFSIFAGGVFVVLLAMAARLRLPGMRNPLGLTIAGGIGGALLYVILRWAILPSTNPMMGNVPQGTFFISHLAFGLVVGLAVGIVVARGHLAGDASPVPARLGEARAHSR